MTATTETTKQLSVMEGLLTGIRTASASETQGYIQVILNNGEVNIDFCEETRESWVDEVQRLIEATDYNGTAFIEIEYEETELTIECTELHEHDEGTDC